MSSLPPKPISDCLKSATYSHSVKISIKCEISFSNVFPPFLHYVCRNGFHKMMHLPNLTQFTAPFSAGSILEIETSFNMACWDRFPGHRQEDGGKRGWRRTEAKGRLLATSLVVSGRKRPLLDCLHDVKHISTYDFLLLLYVIVRKNKKNEFSIMFSIYKCVRQ